MTEGAFLEHVCRQSVVMVDTREGHIGTDVPSVREEAGYSFWVVQQLKVVGFPELEGVRSWIPKNTRSPV